MIKFKTVEKTASAEQTIEKSKFITYISPASSVAEAEAFIAAIREKHRDATHNVPVYIIGEKSELQWASDDGEPSGTSGAPMLHLLEGEEITNVVIVVTRYFGGIKLGTGGLSRAYTGSAKLGIDAAGICGMQDISILKFSLDYSYYGKLKNLEDSDVFTIVNTDFTDVVEVTLEAPEEDTARIVEIITDLTNGRCREVDIDLEKKLGKCKI